VPHAAPRFTAQAVIVQVLCPLHVGASDMEMQLPPTLLTSQGAPPFEMEKPDQDGSDSEKSEREAASEGYTCYSVDMTPHLPLALALSTACAGEALEHALNKATKNPSENKTKTRNRMHL